MRLVALIACVLAVCACGPQGPADEGGAPARPLEVLTTLPSPGDLRGEPAQEVDPAGLARAMTGADDPRLTEAVGEQAPRAAAVRRWTDPRGGELVAAVSVWGSHVVATGIGSDLAARLVDDGGRSWTPAGVPAARGARRGEGARAERRLGHAIGPNALYVRATGDVGEAVAVRAMERMILVVEGQTGSLRSRD
ncbi:hypothetical protein [Miltoncostaea marina]|uniref:hypothetical protein n=1 Tax=Miltoncostaea marina TaxID=2843215 RepID=UPI001C3C29E1|nr:hypothetical protein [Miltoncostaea marina]